jgi:hypothetical protein
MFEKILTKRNFYIYNELFRRRFKRIRPLAVSGDRDADQLDWQEQGVEIFFKEKERALSFKTKLSPFGD